MANPKTVVYVDGFNLYYGAIKGTGCKWLDIHALCALLLPQNDIHAVKYFTAMVSGKEDPQNPVRQNTYIRALLATAKVQIFKGLFSYNDVWRPIVSPKVSNPHTERQLFSKSTITVQVRDAKEKSSDVNLASHLITDAWLNLYDVAVVISNDSDLAMAIQLVKEHQKKIVGIINPQRACKMASELGRLADFKSDIRLTHLTSCQLPSPITAANGKQISKPNGW